MRSPDVTPREESALAKQLDSRFSSLNVSFLSGQISAGVGVPLHPGAERFYKEAGLLK